MPSRARQILETAAAKDPNAKLTRAEEKAFSSIVFKRTIESMKQKNVHNIILADEKGVKKNGR